KSSASRNATNAPHAIASPRFRAADTPQFACATYSTREPYRRMRAAVSSVEPSSMTTIWSGTRVCVNALSIASAIQGPLLYAGITTVTDVELMDLSLQREADVTVEPEQRDHSNAGDVFQEPRVEP